MCDPVVSVLWVCWCSGGSSWPAASLGTLHQQLPCYNNWYGVTRSSKPWAGLFGRGRAALSAAQLCAPGSFWWEHASLCIFLRKLALWQAVGRMGWPPQKHCWNCFLTASFSFRTYHITWVGKWKCRKMNRQQKFSSAFPHNQVQFTNSLHDLWKSAPGRFFCNAFRYLKLQKGFQQYFRKTKVINFSYFNVEKDVKNGIKHTYKTISNPSEFLWKCESWCASGSYP